MVKNVLRFRAGSLVKREHYPSSGDAARPPPASKAGPTGPTGSPQNWTVSVAEKNVTLAGGIQRYSAMRLLRM